MHDDYCPDVDAMFEDRYCVDEWWIEYPEDYCGYYEDDDDFPDDDSPMVGATDEVQP